MIKNNLIKVIRFEKEFFANVVLKASFLFPTLLLMFVAYLYSITNRTISVDDIAQNLYYANNGIKIGSLRWGQVIVNRVFSTINLSPFVNRFFGALFIYVSGVLLSSIIYYLLDYKKNIEYTIMTGVFITYPLINEFYEYYEALTIPVDFVIVLLAVLYQLINGKLSIKDYLLLSFVLSMVVSGYESLIIVYITVVLVILFAKCFLQDQNCRGGAFKLA